MGQAESGVFQAALLDRRMRLFAVRERARESVELTRLIDEVDAALRRMEAGEYGLCEHCHDPIEKDRLVADPLTRFCLDHLTREDQRALEDDLSMARQIQAALLPKPVPRESGWEARYRYEPAGPVSGDYLDMIPADGQGPSLFLTGDVSGKGVAASLLVSHLHSMFRSMSGWAIPLPQMMARANRLLCESTLPEHYATLACAAGRDSGDVEISIAGHCPPLLVRDGHVVEVESSGLPLGMFCTTVFPSRKFKLNPGELLVFYTDGVTEAVSPQDEPYGVHRLSEALERCRGLTIEETVDACLSDWDTFRAGVPPKDDVTLLVVRRN